MYKFIKCIFTILIVQNASFGQDGLVDNFYTPGLGPGNRVNDLVFENDKIFIVGDFISYNGVIRNHIAKLNMDGSLDESFESGIGANGNLFTLAIQEDGKIIVGGDFYNYDNIQRLNIARLNTDGSLDLSFNSQYGFDGNSGLSDHVKSMFIQEDGKIVVAGEFNTYFGDTVNRIARLNVNGSLDTTFNYGGSGASFNINKIAKQSDGKIIVVGQFVSFNGEVKNNIVRLNQDGSLDNTFNTGAGTNVQILDASVQQDDKIIIVGQFISYNGVSCNRIARLNSDGTLDPTFNIGSGFNTYPFSTSIQKNGKIIVGGNFDTYNGTISSRIARLNSDGTLDSLFRYLMPLGGSILKTILQDDGKIFISGSFTNLDGSGISTLARLKSGKGVTGSVYSDANEDCVRTNLEIGLSERNIILNPGNIILQTNSGGIWYLDSLPAGNYTVTVDTTNTNWAVTCPITQSFTVVHADSLTIAPSFGMISNIPCSEPSVSIHMPFVRRCFTSQLIYIKSCNLNMATGALPDAYSIVELDPNLIFENASIPFTSLGNNQYRFEHDTLFPGECVNYTISAQVSCDAILGGTLCMEANLYPVAACVLDTIPIPPTGEVSPCTLPWDQSSLSVEGWCANDSIYFTITNTGQFGGGDMECYSPVRIFVDGVLIQLDSVLLQGGETFTYAFAGTAQTWILQADQHPLHPGNSHPNAHVENCGTGTWTPDLVNDLPLDDADPVVDIYCGIVTGSYDPNDKRGFPSGISDEHFIAKNQELEYIIRFQNTGTDTAFTVVVRDTLDENFNIFTVTPGVSSHPYTFRMYGPRVLEWTFANILLPDSTTNEPLSNGFLTFTVKQNPDLAEGTVLRNDADIYFDFNDPIITNETDHKISYQINNMASLEKLKTQKSNLKLYPNPTNSSITIDLNNFSKSVNYKIYSLSGKLLQEKRNIYGQKISVDVKNLENGLYFIEIEHDTKIEVLNFVKN